jgi:23S rRNA pseudouridine2605 synthase
MARERLDKRLSARSGFSRTEAGKVIRRGRVTVNGEEQDDPGYVLPEGAVVALDGVAFEDPLLVALFHKPLDIQCTVGDPWGRPSLTEVAGKLLDMGLHPVGRLDADTDGLLIFSADGTLTQRLLHPRHGVVKLYRAEVEGNPDERLTETLRMGVETADGTFSGEVRGIEGSVVMLAVQEGKHRMVRKMLNNAGFPVKTLRRVAFGPFTLGELAPGAWRAPTPEELAALQPVRPGSSPR